MNSVRPFIIATMFAALPVLSALAAPPNSGIPEIPQSAEQRASQQVVTGPITEINNRDGLISIRSAEGIVRLHFPPASLSNLKKGDTISVQYAFAKPDSSTGGSRAYDMPKGYAEHRMSGTVSKVDHATGWLNVRTDEAELRLHFAPQMLQDLKDGDRITVDLSFSKVS